MYNYAIIQNHFTLPKHKNSEGFYNDKRLPRKLKKKMKKYCGIHWDLLSLGQRQWMYLGYVNQDYRRFLIKMICNGNL